MPSSRTRLYLILAALIAAAVVVFVLARGRAGGTRSSSAPPAAGTADDPWGAEGAAEGPGGFGARRGPGGSASGWLKTRVAGPPVVVTGVVRLAPGGAVVADAEVAFMNDTGENTALTDAAGRYSIKVASAIAWKVHARTDTAVGYPESYIATGDNPVRDLEIHPTATVRGKVIDMRGAAVPGAEVSLFVDAASRNLLESALPLSTVADGGGRFELPSLPGAVTVKGVSGLRQGVGILATLAPGETAEVEIRLLDAMTVTGRVVDDKGDGVAGAKILTAVTITPGGPTEKTQFDSKADGSFELALPAGWLRLEARHAGEISAASAQWVGSGERLDGVTLTLASPTGLRGKVVASSGAAVSGAKVRLVANAVYDATTGGNGSFVVMAPPGQPYLVKIKHSDGMLERQIASWNGEEVFVMKPFGGIRVVAEGARGEVSVTIDSFLAAGEPTPRAPTETRFRSAGAAVELRDLEPGLYDLTVTAGAAGSVRAPRIAVAEGAVREVKVKLAPPVTVRGTVKTGNQPVSGARVAIGGKSGFSDSKGRWTVIDVASGPISVIVTKTGFSTAWGSGVAAADADAIAIDLRPSSDGPGQVEGIGVVLAPAAQGAVVTSVLPGSPADGKLAPGDLIEEVGGADVTAAPVEEIVARLRGAAGSSVSIEYRRGGDTSTVDLVRKRLVVPQGAAGGGIATRAPGRAAVRPG